MKKRAIINFLASTVYQISNILIGLLIPKYYTEIFGSVYNGLNQSVTQIMSLLSVLQLGISAAAIQLMFKYIAADDKNMIRAIYRDTGKQYRKMGYVFLAVVLPIAFCFPFLLKEDLPYNIIVAFLLFRIVSSAMEYFFQAKYNVILIAHNKSYAIYVINTVLLLISTALHLTVLFTVQNILLYQAVAVVSTILRFIIVTVYIRKKFPFLQQTTETECAPPKENKRKDVLVSEVAGMIIDSTDMLVLSTFSGLVSTSIYSVYNFVVAGIGNVMSSCREAVFAGLGKTYYQDFRTFQSKFDGFESIYLFLAFFLYSVTILLFRPFIEVYTANMDAQYFYAGFPILFVLCKLLVNMRIPSIVAINTAGHFKEVKKYAVMEAALNLGLSLLLVKPLGIYGVLLGTIIGAAFRTPILVWYSNKHIVKRTQMAYWKKILVWLPFFLTAYAVSVIKPIQCHSLPHWLLTAVPTAGVVLVLAVLWMFVFDRKTFRMLWGILGKVLHRKEKKE